MRFNTNSKSAVTLQIISVYILYLGFSSQLSLYIHPRYIFFTMVLSAVILIASFSSIDTTESDEKIGNANFILAFVIAAAIILPAQVLSVSTVNQRLDVNTNGTTATTSRDVEALLLNSSKGLKIEDWAQLLATKPDPAFYANKPVDVTGFVFDAGLGNDIFMLSRFTVTCCAVDARPAGIPVYLPNWQEQLDEDQWLHIEGMFELNNDVLSINPSVVEKIEEPTNPYES